MNTILIAEDEKLLRAGLKTMTQRSGVPVGTILEARDGLEALELLRSKKIDLLITDIRMPKMDGIELVSRLSELDDPPAVLVVSGYDDFSYAVEMMRNGVQDYLLKPVEREQFYQAVKKAEAQYQKKEAARKNGQWETMDALRQLMLEADDRECAVRERMEHYSGRFFPENYVGFCAPETEKQLPEHTLKLRAVGPLMFYAAEAPESGALLKLLAPPVGQSGVHFGLEELNACYREAYSAWQMSFFTGKLETEGAPYQPCGIAAEQLAGLAGLSKWHDISEALRKEAGRVADREVHPEAFADLCRLFVEQLERTYPDLVDEQHTIRIYAKIWNFGNIGRYLDTLDGWLEDFCGRTAVAFSDFENKQKIREAVQYVQTHFREPLNMAEVSNRISMNYSLFSTLFKQYTGVNFVNYIQKLRIHEAERLLETTDFRVYEIGRRVGFSDDKHFLKIFKTLTGFSPTEYRKSKALMERKDADPNGQEP